MFTVIAKATVLSPTPLNVRLVPVKSNPPVNSTKSLNVVEPVPANCKKLAALNVEDAVTSLAFVMAISPSGLRLPTAPVKVMLPSAPASKVRGRALPLLSSVPPKAMSSPTPPPLVMVTPAELVRPTALANAIPALALVIFPPIALSPVPLWVNPSAAEIFTPSAVVKTPLLSTNIVVPTVLLPKPFNSKLFPVKANAFVKLTKSANFVS